MTFIHIQQLYELASWPPIKASYLVPRFWNRKEVNVARAGAKPILFMFM